MKTNILLYLGPCKAENPTEHGCPAFNEGLGYRNSPGRWGYSIEWPDKATTVLSSSLAAFALGLDPALQLLQRGTLGFRRAPRRGLRGTLP
jgi:hypothetical protein